MGSSRQIYPLRSTLGPFQRAGPPSGYILRNGLTALVRDWQSGTQPALAETTETHIGTISQSLVAIGILMNAKRRSTVFANLWLRNYGIYQ